MSLLRQRTWAWLAATIFAMGAPAAFSQARTPVTCASPHNDKPAPTEYFVSLAANAEHLAHVSIRFTQVNAPIALAMPVWNALYQVRDFSANIEDVRAQGAAGQSLPLQHANPSEWEVAPAGPCVVVDYDIHLDHGGPFGTQLNSEHGFFNWAMVLMYSPSTRSQSMTLQLLDVPSSWSMQDVHLMGQTAAGQVEGRTGIAQNYDELVDSPLELGSFQRFDFQQDGATYHIAVHASPSDYNSTKLVDSLKRITRAQTEWMADRPFDSYTFLYHFPRGHGAGGMEHAYGTAIDINADRLNNDLMPVLGVSSHEFFHLWNVKRIRPQSLEPIDYQHAMDTRPLWFSEGLTSTVGDLMLARAGIFNERQYLDRVASEITELQARPARRWQSVEQSGLEAWFEGNSFYRTPERSISYYNKGEIVGVLLDLRIRQLTDDHKSLRDLFRWMNDNYAKKGLFFPGSEGVQKAADAVTGQSFAEFFRNYVDGVQEIPYNEFFAFVGLQAAEATGVYSSPGFTTSANLGGQPEVASVESNSDAFRNGIIAGDRILQLNGKPASSSFDYDVSQLKAGSTVKLRVAGKNGERNVKLKLVSRETRMFLLQDVANMTSEQRAHRTAWVHGDDEDGGGQ